MAEVRVANVFRTHFEPNTLRSATAHGPGAGSGLLPRLPPPTCSRPVSGVGLGPFCYAASLLRSLGPCPPPVFRSAICDCLLLNVSFSLCCFFVLRLPCRGLPPPTRPQFSALRSATVCHQTDSAPFVRKQMFLFQSKKIRVKKNFEVIQYTLSLLARTRSTRPTAPR